jgi:hypothetical protein
MHLGRAVSDVEKLSIEIDECINNFLGCSAKRIEDWYGDDSLSFNITYQLGLLDIDVWRDRGLYSLLIASSNGEMFHCMDKICAFINENDVATSAVSYPYELSAQLEFIKDKQSQIEALFQRENIDINLDQYGEYGSIPRSNA